MSKLTKVYNGMYTISQLMDMAVKLGLSVPETDEQFQQLADDVRDKREYQVILEIEDGFEAEDAQRSESERVIRAFVDDLIGTRRSLQDKVRNELVRSFCEHVFNKAVEKLTANPFALNTAVFVHEKDFEQYSQILCMIVNEGSYSLSKRLTTLLADLDIKKIEISTSHGMIGVVIDYE